MAGLLGSLSMAARALDAQRFGLDVAGQNIANVNTPGYARREAQFASVPPYEKLSAGEGVEVRGMHSLRDERLERRLQQERPAEQRELAISESLAVVETALGKTGESLDASMSGFFDSLGRLAADPTSAIARQEAASQGDALSGAFRDMSGRLDQATRDADVAIRGAVNQVNTLAGTIARLNAALGAASGGAPGGEALKDELGEALKSLSGLIDIGTIPRPDGGVDVSFGNGHPLVIGANTYALGVSSTPPTVFASLVSGGATVTSEVTGGSIGGLLQVRDVLVPGYQNQLDTLAYGIVQQVNAVHQTGYDIHGATGADFFTPMASSANAARSMSVSAGILADPGTIATGATAIAGDNDVARKLADLRDARGLSGGTATFSDAWGTLVYQVGADSRAASDEQTSRAEIVRQVELLREQVSGVSLDEEAMMMMKFQRAYEANARFFQAVDSALDTLLSLKR
jgi:flagellar hook-associated protein 1 FlgK